MSDYQPLYHGTRRGFGRGGRVLPGDLFGADNHGLGRSHVVYVTPDLELAKEYARAAKGRGAPKVLEVMPVDPLGIDDSTVGEEEQEAYTCSEAKVLKVVWKEPKTEEGSN